MKNTLWELFCETGDPLAFMLYRAAERAEKERPCGSEEQAAG